MKRSVFPGVFWPKVDKTPGHGPQGTCWVWTGMKKTGGYGLIKIGGVVCKAHRVSYEIANGPIPYAPGYHGNCVLHECDNPACVRPDHLYLGRPKENSADMIRRGRAPDHKGEKNEAVKLTEGQVRAIRKDVRPASRVAPDYGVHETTILRIRTRVLWAHISGELTQ